MLTNEINLPLTEREDIKGDIIAEGKRKRTKDTEHTEQKELEKEMNY